MLHQDPIETSTLELIKNLQSKEYLQGFYLVGVTALALKKGYRKSIDIYYLLCDFNIASMLSFYKNKYNQQSETIVLKSLI